MYTLQILNAFTAGPYESMTYPNFQQRLRQMETCSLAIGASCEGRPVGLALAEAASEARFATILSVYVDSAHRHRGIGTALVARLEAELRARGCTQLEFVYSSDTSSTLAVERILKKRRWSLPQVRMLICSGEHGQILKAPAITRCRLPAGFSILPWCELSSEDRKTIQSSRDVKPWYPEMFSPFRDEEFLEPLGSLGLRYERQIVGWLIIYRLSPDIVRYSSFFVRGDLRDKGCGLPLLAESLRRHMNAHGPTSLGSFGVRVDNTSMVRFVRRVAPFLPSVRETRGTFKSLVAP